MIFVTGGTGFLGRHLIAALCRSGASIRLLTRHPEQYPWLGGFPHIEIVKGDLADRELIMGAVSGSQAIIHAGGMFRFWGDEDAFMQANALGTQNIVDAAVAASVERFIHISSIAVIGQPDPAEVIDEGYPPAPVDAYQRSKYEGEQIVHRAYQEHDLPAIILRPGAFYGPLGEYGFNRLFFRDSMRGIMMHINGGKHIIFPAYIADVVQGIMKALDHGEVGEVYNICGDWISHKEAFSIVRQEAKLVWPRLYIPGWLGIRFSQLLEVLARLTGREPFWPINLQSYVYNDWHVSNQKAREKLRFEPTDFREGARQTIAWYRSGRPDDIPETKC